MQCEIAHIEEPQQNHLASSLAEPAFSLQSTHAHLFGRGRSDSTRVELSASHFAALRMSRGSGASDASDASDAGQLASGVHRDQPAERSAIWRRHAAVQCHGA